ncbi:ribose-5-phosphate isomerase RpiA [Burkholderiaceae bacterium FT117]|uniref:ribose-5-phosphate isomerase RpiA n=1 Tax=Zeimonas sediminis TaxID=2944268 RepID=UPI0023432257|nr:ribose-5-phosphate isomerase RpiA [Zeimonas sediminis]MCM5569775.1 ribose-5-phosphate isomerase RpiA [Zeimonas sediminis]
MNQDELKKLAARAALDELVDGAIVGVGSGSTVNFFIDFLGERRDRVAGAVSSSEKSSARLRERGIEVLDLNQVVAAGRPIPVYVDGADEIDAGLRMIKGGGGALTREKIVAAACGRFVCIVDASKLVERLGAFPLPVEVIPMARELVASRLRELGGHPVERAGFVTDNGNLILDVAGLRIEDPVEMETRINQWPGVVTVGLFASRPADMVLIAKPGGIERRSLRGGT